MRAHRLVRVFAPFIQPHWHRLAFGIALVLAGTVTSLLRPWPLKYLFDELLVPDPAVQAVGTLVFLVVIAYAVVNAADGALRGLRRYVLKSTGQQVAFDLQATLFSRLQALDLTFHHRQSTGELVNRLTRDVDKVQDLSTETLVEAASHALKLLGMLGVILWLDWRLSLAMLVLVPFLGLATAYYRRRLRSAERLARGEEGEVASLAQEDLAAIKLVKAYGREDFEQRRFEGHAREATSRYIGVWRTEALLGGMVDVLVAGGTAAMVWLGAWRVLAGTLSPGDLFVLISYLREFYDPISSLSKLSGRVSRITARAERIADVLVREPAVRDLPGARPAPRFHGRIEFDHVDFQYESGQPVLRDVSFSILPGHVLGLAGPSGAGKSTIAQLVSRLYDPTAGRVLIDGVDVREYTLSSVRSQITWVLQRTILFRASIRDNIAFGRPDATDEEIMAAAHAANIHSFITTLPDGYDTRIGEGGETLSGGQRQMIAIARALLRDAPIVILDEPTTGLDMEARRAVLDALELVTHGRTTIVIAHDFDLVRRADLILFIEEGRITERGTHDELHRRGGRYAKMAKRR